MTQAEVHPGTPGARPMIRCAACGDAYPVLVEVPVTDPDLEPRDPRHGYLRAIELACGHRRLVEPVVLRNAPREGEANADG